MTKGPIISEGNSYEEALNSGLRKLDSKLEEVEVKIIQEKKASLFRKAYVQLEIMKKDKILEQKIEKIDKKLYDNDTSIANDDVFFQINYLPDGVYITITSNTIKDMKTKRKLILDYLSQKSVKNYDVEEIDRCLNSDIPVTKKIAPYQEEVKIYPKINIEISKDKLEAYLIIAKGDKGLDVSLDDVKEKLRENGIVYGVNDESLQEVISNKIFDLKVLIAKGTKPQHGKDGRITYHFDVEKDHKPEYLEDGSVDFKSLNLINNVKKGQLLVEITPPTEGTTGTNVLGEMIPALKGKPLKIVKGKNIQEDEDGLKFYSDVDGQVFFRDGKLQVSQIYEIPGNVDHSIGNISFNGKVLIKGNVRSGFTVEADGDIEVSGVVEGSRLISKGNIILNRGIQGNNQAYLQCEGNLISNYIENSTIKCSGNIEANCILHSNVVSKGSITVNGKRGLIVGGQVRAAEDIRSKTIGSHMGTITILEVGIDPDEKLRYEKLKKEISEIEKNLSNLKKTIDLLGKLAKDNNLNKSKEEMFVKSIKTYEHFKNKHEALSNELKLIEDKMQDLSRGKIHVSDRMYPGAKITILNSVRHIYDEITHCTLYKKDGDIVIGPYEK